VILDASMLQVARRIDNFVFAASLIGCQLGPLTRLSAVSRFSRNLKRHNGTVRHLDQVQGVRSQLNSEARAQVPDTSSSKPKRKPSYLLALSNPPSP
jgi:hypothetical protein